MDVTRVIAKLEPGGAQLSALRVTEALRTQGIRTDRFLVGEATPEGLALARRFGIEAEVFAPMSGLQWRPCAEFAAWLRPRLADAQLVHAHMFGAWWAAAQVVPAGASLIASEHNEMSWPGSEADAAAAECAAARAVQRVDAFFAHGPAAREFALRIGVPVERLHDGRSPIAGAAECDDGLAAPTLRSPRITFTGRLTPDKGADVLVEALSLLPDPPLSYIVGAGPLLPRLQAAVRAHGLADRVVFTGWSYSPTRYVEGASAHVVPSRQEAWSQSAVTALGLGAPVIGTAVDGLRNTLACGRGVLVPADDPAALAGALQRVLGGERRDPRPGLAYAAQYTPGTVASGYAEHYHRLAHRLEYV